MEVHKLIKPVISDIVNYDHTVKVCSMQLPTKKNGIVNIKTLPNLNYFTRYVTRIKDSENNEIANYEYDHNYSKNCIEGLFLGVNSFINRNNGSRLGELLRLTSIIEMFENGFDAISLFSKDSAIYFHSKYGFKAKVDSLSQQAEFLKLISNDSSDCMLEVSQKASSLLNKMSKEKLQIINCKYTKEINELLNEYIQLAQKSDNPYAEHGLKKGVYMDLTKEEVLNNKDFYNKLFENHGIDYTI